MTVERPESEQYTHGYHPVIVGSYTQRTAETCAAFLLPRLKPDATVLDIGCGPGRFLPGWVHAAGFVDPVVTTSTTTYADAAGRELWGGMWAVRVTDSDFAQHAVSGGFATRGDLVAISVAFRRWAENPSGFWAYLNGEVVAVRPTA